MKIKASDNALGYELFYEEMDEVQVKSRPTNNCLIQEGDRGFITENQTDVQTFIDVAFDTLVRNGWGDMSIPISSLEPYGITKKKLPELIQEWKQQQIKKLLGVSSDERS